ncbi:LacI family DNA-binding transcriptional regulator [Nocardioides sp.]|uniref:LacI family DNA-binding transcriptional regulator n=1 Tax=Nocardioides sp. TaxID=35761 RepID=UPI00286E98A9|nr:LacI family DNA-binding transcriptional regulator [Nocardioides sp.]
MAVRSVTLVDVARRAGVSRTTASYVLNGRAERMRIAPLTVERVRSAVAELGYRPNRSAQTLRTSTTSTIGVLSDHVASGHYASSMLTGASAAARRADHLVVIGESEGDVDLEALHIQEMLDRQVDGIVYARLVTSTVIVPDSLRDQRVVLLNCVDEQRSYPALLPDERAGARSAVETLAEAGVAGDVWVVGDDPTPHALAGPLRMAGIREALDELGTPLAGVVSCPWAARDAHDAVHHWLMSGVRPGALVCLNDRVAMGAYQALATHGLDVPGDVSVVSFDGTELATWLRPPVASVELPYTALGELAVEALTGAEELTPSIRWVPMGLVPGRSVPDRERPFH